MKSDTQLQQDVSAELAWEASVNAAQIGVEVKDGVVTLAGNVLAWSTYWPQDQIKVMVEAGWITLTGELDWEYQRAAAERAVRGLMGVVGVTNQIALNPKDEVRPVKSEIEAALRRRIHSDARHIQVGVNGSEVTLSGTVHSWSERDTARNSAWATPGVRNDEHALPIGSADDFVRLHADQRIGAHP